MASGRGAARAGSAAAAWRARPRRCCRPAEASETAGACGRWLQLLLLWWRWCWCYCCRRPPSAPPRQLARAAAAGAAAAGLGWGWGLLRLVLSSPGMWSAHPHRRTPEAPAAAAEGGMVAEMAVGGRCRCCLVPPLVLSVVVMLAEQGSLAACLEMGRIQGCSWRRVVRRSLSNQRPDTPVCWGRRVVQISSQVRVMWGRLKGKMSIGLAALVVLDPDDGRRARAACGPLSLEMRSSESTHTRGLGVSCASLTCARTGIDRLTLVNAQPLDRTRVLAGGCCVGLPPRRIAPTDVRAKVSQSEGRKRESARERAREP